MGFAAEISKKIVELDKAIDKTIADVEASDNSAIKDVPNHVQDFKGLAADLQSGTWDMTQSITEMNSVIQVAQKPPTLAISQITTYAKEVNDLGKAFSKLYELPNKLIKLSNSIIIKGVELSATSLQYPINKIEQELKDIQNDITSTIASTMESTILSAESFMYSSVSNTNSAQIKDLEGKLNNPGLSDQQRKELEFNLQVLKAKEDIIKANI